VKNLRLIFAAIGIVVLVATSLQASPTWLTDFPTAQQLAKTKQKLVLLNFTGSGWCMKLDKEVFSRPEFQQYAEKNLVLVEVDFPRRKEQSASLRAQNSKLAEQYEVEGFPTIIVLNGDGKKVGELGYIAGGAPAFIAELEKLSRG
jgi:thioredoxin-related protein